jgi:hypothetical protein
MPIAGAVRVEPSEVATTLTAVVALAAGLSGLGATDRPEWIARVKKDPATLREMLAAGGSLPARPSVTELQRRGHRLHPSPAASTRAARSTDAAAAVVPIGLAAVKHEDAEPEIAAAAATVPPAVESRWNRRLGVVSLGSAAAAGAVMIALALGGARGPGIVTAEPFLPPVSHGPSFGTGGATQNPDGDGGTTTTGGGQTGPGSGSGTSTSTPLGTIQLLGGASGTGNGSTTGATGGSGSGTGGAPGGAGTHGGPRSSSAHLPGARGAGGAGGTPGQSPTPGGSGDHNPHGGPPGHSAGHGGQGGTNGNGQANGHGAHTNAGHGNGGPSGSHGKSSDAHGHKR